MSKQEKIVTNELHDALVDILKQYDNLITIGINSHHPNRNESLYSASLYIIHCLNSYITNNLHDEDVSFHPTIEIKLSNYSEVYLGETKLGFQSKSIYYKFTESVKGALSQISSLKKNDILPPIKPLETKLSSVGIISNNINDGQDSELQALESFINLINNKEELTQNSLEKHYKAICLLIHPKPINKLAADEPTADDKLGRTPLIKAISKTIKETESSFTVGIFGDWGIGKSSFIAAVKNQLLTKKGVLNSQIKERSFLFSEFNAWRYEQTDHLQSGMAQVMIDRLSDIRTEQSVQETQTIDWKRNSSNLIESFLVFLVAVGLSIVLFYLPLIPIFQDTFALTAEVVFIAIAMLYFTHKTFPESVNCAIKPIAFRFHLAYKLHSWVLLLSLASLVFLITSLIPNGPIVSWLQKLEIPIWFGPLVGLPILFKSMKTILASTAAKELKTYLELPSYAKNLGLLPNMRDTLKTMCEVRLGNEHRLLYIVEDLDRCRPDSILKVLEAVRLVMDLKHVTVVILVDQRIALAALAKHFSDIEEYSSRKADELARDYLAKIIQLGITLEATSEIDKLIEHSVKKDTWLPSTYGMSETQLNRFIHLAKKFKINSPRTLTRLTNLYNNLRTCYQEIEDIEFIESPYPLLTNMMFIEWALNQEMSIFEELKILFDRHIIILSGEFKYQKLEVETRKNEIVVQLQSLKEQGLANLEMHKLEQELSDIEITLEELQYNTKYFTEQNQMNQNALKIELKKHIATPYKYDPQIIESLIRYDNKNGYYFNLVKPFLLPHA